MENKERKLARRYDSPERCRGVVDIVYGGNNESKNELLNKMGQYGHEYDPAPNEYNIYFGELHGHTNLSDGRADIDDYFTSIRDKAGLDFAALSDHDHGGVGGSELWGEKWELTREKVKKYYEPGKFTTILAYERDSYPWYTNMIVYYNNHDGEMIRGEFDGEVTRAELREMLAREDILIVPHDTATLGWGTDFLSLELQDMAPLMQVYSRYNYSERYDRAFLFDSDCDGGHWLDALNMGARMGCIASSDDHSGTNGLTMPEKPYPHNYPGIACVWAKENTLPSIFEALKARRCYGIMGGRIVLDFRINGHYMGEEISDEGDERAVYYKIEADGELDTVTVVKNGRDYMILDAKSELLFLDYRKEKAVDYYYIRTRLKDGRMAWSSPIWIGNV